MTIEQALLEQVAIEFEQNWIDVDTTLVDEVVDSLGLFVLISFVEERFGIGIEPDDVTFENFRNIRAVADLVRAKQAGAP